MSESVRRELDRYGATELLGSDAFCETVGDAITAFEQVEIIR